jgi:uncharacterized protein (DUF1810 family)
VAFELERFVAAQAPVYGQALAEITRGRKTSHWMWFVFPQLAGLGFSAMSQRYAISSLAEARAYVVHPVLGPRLAECVAAALATTGRSAEQIFGGVDAQKLHSSMTLFHRAAPDDPAFAAALERFFDGVSDAATDRLLVRSTSRDS